MRKLPHHQKEGTYNVQRQPKGHYHVQALLEGSTESGQRDNARRVCIAKYRCIRRDPCYMRQTYIYIIIVVKKEIGN